MDIAIYKSGTPFCMLLLWKLGIGDIRKANLVNALNMRICPVINVPYLIPEMQQTP